MNWKVLLLGPKGTPYRGGIFTVSIRFPQAYPQEAPEIRFVTTIYHLMVNSKCFGGIVPGDVQLNKLYLINSLDCWPHEHKIEEILKCIFSLFYKQDYRFYYLDQIYNEYWSMPAVFDAKIRYFTKKYANPLRLVKIYSRTMDWDFNFP